MNHIENLCIHHLFEFQVDQKPDAIAILFGEKHLTYRELNQQATLLAYYLQSLGVSPEAQDLGKIKYKDETPEKLLLCTTFIDKKRIIRQVPKLASRLPFRSNNEDDRAFKRIENVRNQIAHGDSVISVLSTLKSSTTSSTSCGEL